MEALLARVAAAASRHRRLFVGGWVVALLVAAPFAAQTQSRLSSGGFTVPGSQSQRVTDFFNQLAGTGAQPVTILVRAPTAAEASRRMTSILSAVTTREPRLHFLAQLLGSPDRRVLVALGEASSSQNEALALAGRLVNRYQDPTAAVQTYILGPAATYYLFQKITSSALAQAEGLTAPVILLVLVASFGAVVAATVPVMLGVGSVVVTLAVVYVIAAKTEVSIYAATMVSMIGIGVAVDYSMFIIARFREELARGASRELAVQQAMRTSGTAVVFSGLTVILSLFSIWVVPVRAVQSMAAGAIIVVAVAILAAATFLPAVLSLLGDRINHLRLGRRHRPEAAVSSFWTRWVAAVMRRPAVSFAAGAAFLLALTTPAFFLITQNRALDQLSPTTAIARGTAILAGSVTGPGQGRSGAVVLVVHPLPGRSASTIMAEARSVAAATARTRAISSVWIEQYGGALAILAPLRVDPESAVAENQVVGAVRTIATRSSLSHDAGIDVGGVSAFNYDLNNEVGGDLWKVMALVVVLSYLVLMVLLRSVLLPLKAVLMNLLSIGASYGVLVMIFQWGWLDFTGYRHLGHLNTLNPALILAITFGLSMDYEVFLLSRIKERYDAHQSNEQAVAEGIAGSARLITSAAAIMVVVFGGFALTGVATIKEIGVGLSVAIALDATITRLVLVPAAMRLFGEWNWWMPAWLDRLIPHIAHQPRDRVAATPLSSPSAR